MRSSQWFLIGFFLIVMGTWFVMIDNVYSCNLLDTSSMLNKADIYGCINSEIYDPFIWLLYPLGMVFIICGWIEVVAKERKRK